MSERARHSSLSLSLSLSGFVCVFLNSLVSRLSSRLPAMRCYAICPYLTIPEGEKKETRRSRENTAIYKSHHRIGIASHQHSVGTYLGKQRDRYCNSLESMYCTYICACCVLRHPQQYVLEPSLAKPNQPSRSSRSQRQTTRVPNQPASQPASQPAEATINNRRPVAAERERERAASKKRGTNPKDRGLSFPDEKSGKTHPSM